MKLPMKMQSGRPDMPVVLLIHGLGMNNYFWADPEKCFVLGGLAPLTIFLADAANKPQNTLSFGTMASDLQGFWYRLETAGFSLASWSQSQPLGPVHIAIAELEAAMQSVRNKWPGKPVYLVGHSRGGLIARHFLLKERAPDVAGLITICSPHSGTSMAKFVRFLKPVGGLLEKIIPQTSQAAATRALGRLSTFLQSPAIEELTPGSAFLAAMKKKLPRDLRKLSFGGTSPALFQLIIRFPANNHKVVRFPDLLLGAIPTEHIPEELIPGRGDALVTAESARLPGSTHYDFTDNHVKAAFDSKLQESTIAFMQG